MCQIIVKKAGKKVDFDKLNKAQEWNEDGYGVTWWEEGELETFKTMNFKKFKALLSTMKDNDAVIHLRKTSRGSTCVDNNHPFPIPSGYMFHNGTVSSLSCDAQGGSDTKALAELISACKYDYVEDIMPFIKEIIGDKINRLVFFEDDGKITIVNEELGMWEDDIWYSNDYHKKEKTVHKPTTSSNGTEYEYDKVSKKWLPKAKKEVEWKNGTKIQQPKTKVFVYGTLKKGYGNHYLLADSKFVGEATSVSKWLMIGKDMPFPYLLNRDNTKGKHIKGEVYEVDSNTLKRLDALEGVPTHYKKDWIYVTYANGLSENVSVYVKTNAINEEYLPADPYIEDFTKHADRGVAVPY